MWVSSSLAQECSEDPVICCKHLLSQIILVLLESKQSSPQAYLAVLLYVHALNLLRMDHNFKKWRVLISGALEHSRVLAIICSRVFTFDHPCIESIQCAHCTMDGLKWKPCYKKSRVLASARVPPLVLIWWNMIQIKQMVCSWEKFWSSSSSWGKQQVTKSL